MKYAILFLMTPGSFVAVGFVGVAAKRAALKVLPRALVISTLTFNKISPATEVLAIETEIEYAIELITDR